MAPSAPPHRWLIILQFWISTLRLIVALYGSIITSFQINAKRTIERNVFDVFDPSEKVLLSFQLGLWIILASNDIYIAAFDFKRTNTYSGCLASQICISASAIILTAISLIRRGNEWTPIILSTMSDVTDEPAFKTTSYGPKLFLFTLPTALGMLLSVCLLLIATWSGYSNRFHIPPRQAWRYNTKDLLMDAAGLSRVSPVLSLAGSPRASVESTQKGIYAPANKMRRLFTNLLFRRVIPVETRLYAMTQNIFALVSIAAILFRTITALRKAHNQIGTRMVAGSCVDDPGIAWEAFTLDLLVAHNRQAPVDYPVTTISMVFNGTTEICSVRGNQTDYSSRIFGCSDAPDGGFSYYFPSDATFSIEVRSVDGRPLSGLDIPDIWLSVRPIDEVLNQTVIPPDDLRSVPGPMVGRAPWAYVPPWSLRPGFQIEAEAQMVIRRFFQSTYLEELVFNIDSRYKREMLFPIVESGTSPLLNDTVATATIRPTLRPAYAYLRDSTAYQDLSIFEKGSYQKNILCTIIEDYRDGSMLDVLGSIGGLYALLQSIHILLFGRAMLWGLTGAKLIAPFGLLGMCRSQAFKRRLRDRYHRQPTRDNPETFLMGAFLRDFVVELGPANFNPDHAEPVSPSNMAASTLSVDQRQGVIDDKALPMKLELGPSFDAAIDIEKLTSHARSRIDSEGSV